MIFGATQLHRFPRSLTVAQSWKWQFQSATRGLVDRYSMVGWRWMMASLASEWSWIGLDALNNSPNALSVSSKTAKSHRYQTKANAIGMHVRWRMQRRQLCHRCMTRAQTQWRTDARIVFNRSINVGEYRPDIRNGYRQELLCAANKNDNPFEHRDHESSACTNIYVCESFRFRLPLFCDFTPIVVVRALDDCLSDVNCQRKMFS